MKISVMLPKNVELAHQFFDLMIEKGLQLVRAQEENGDEVYMATLTTPWPPKNNVDKAHILRDFRTIGVFAPRQTGIAAYVVQKAQADDLVLCSSDGEVKIVTTPFYTDPVAITEGQLLADPTDRLVAGVNVFTVEQFFDMCDKGTNKEMLDKFKRVWITWSKRSLEQEQPGDTGSIYMAMSPYVKYDAVVIRMN